MYKYDHSFGIYITACCIAAAVSQFLLAGWYATFSKPAFDRFGCAELLFWHAQVYTERVLFS